ncbi:MAG: DUF4886 domain-containing protein [Oscillospiraceae bacterium]|nr:DUF4886 domain-containing protein [Oscillospiraceae bacterium]
MNKPFKVLLVAQSLGNDTIWLLYDVLRAEMPDREFVVGNIYQSLSLGQHRKNIESGEKAYIYYKFANDTMQETQDVTIAHGLTDEDWDVIIFNEATYPSTQEKEYLDGDIEFMIDYIRKTATPGFRLCYNATGANPTCGLLWGEDRRRPAAGVQERFMREFGGSRNKYYAMLCANFEKYIETNKEFDLVLHTGTALQYASETYGVPEADPMRNYDLHRDYVHLSDFGRLIAAYQLYTQIFGLEKLEEVKVDVIKEVNRHKESKRFGDLQITQKHKDAIIASVNWALENPNKIPPQTARPDAFLERPDL